MLRNCLICIFSLCLLQLTQARPLVDVADRPSFDECLFMGEIELVSMWGNLFKIYRALFTDTLNELNALPEKSEALRAYITRLSFFLDLSKHLTNGFDLYYLLDEFDAIMQDYKHLPEGDKLTDTLKAAFEKSDLKKYQSELEDDTDAYYDFLRNMCTDNFNGYLKGDPGFRDKYENYIKSESNKLAKN